MKQKTIHILTLFTEYFEPFQSCGVVGKALSGERTQDVRVKLNVVNIRDFATDKYKSVDDTTFGGGAGMVMRADILANAFHEGINKPKNELHVVCPYPRGKVWNNEMAKGWTARHLSLNSHDKDLVFICGRYEGIDERFLEYYVDEFISIGDFILSGGELATMIVLDSALRFVDGILGNKASNQKESFATNRIEHPHYTKPREFEGLTVPEVLLSGHHANIEKFQAEESLRLTKEYRPDLLHE